VEHDHRNHRVDVSSVVRGSIAQSRVTLGPCGVVAVSAPPPAPVLAALARAAGTTGAGPN
jgi:hypothetical protein